MSKAAPRYAFGIDIGGTFTDFVAIDLDSGKMHSHKRLTTPADPSQAVLDGVRASLDALSAGGSNIAICIHGTTLMTNALIERKGVKTGLVTTDGFRDVLEIRTEMRYDGYDLHIDFPEPLVPRPLRLGVRQRMDKDGNVLVPLDREELARAAAIFRRRDVRAIAVCFLHSFKNPAHELEAREVLQAALPDRAISLSFEVAPEIREYPRTSTAVANAYVQPLAERYIDRLERSLKELGYGRQLYLMLSSGGITSAGTASRFPIRLVESGPAAGAIVAGFFGDKIGERNVLSFDMGGTTAKACLISDGAPSKAREFEVARMDRAKKGSGIPVQIPVIDLIEIGAGGGSKAHIDALGLLKVGPESAGADPGPACYGFGGANPTVTDADLVLGYLDPNHFLGGRMKLDRDAATRAIEDKIAGPLGLDPVQAAVGIFNVVNENMASAAKVHVAEQGKDPRRYVLMAFGGAGPIHAHALAKSLKMKRIVCPRGAGVASALGFLAAPVSFEFAQSFMHPLDSLELASFVRVYEEMAANGRDTLLAAGVAESDIRHTRSADMRYIGQGHEITVTLGDDPAAYTHAALRDAFLRAYEALYGHAHTDVPVEVMTCRLVASGPDPKVDLPRVARDPDTAKARKGTRPVYFEELHGYTDCPVYERDGLRAGAELAGPAIVEEHESTAVVPPGARARVDEYQNLHIELP